MKSLSLVMSALAMVLVANAFAGGKEDKKAAEKACTEQHKKRGTADFKECVAAQLAKK